MRLEAGLCPVPDRPASRTLASSRMWSDAQLIRILADSLRHAASEADTAQAPIGIDALDETAIHALIAAGLTGAGWGVLPETPYPGAPGARSAHRDRNRCDLALTPTPAARIADPVRETLARDKAAGTLFEPLVDKIRPTDALTPPEEAFWLEVKVASQFAIGPVELRPNPAYSSEMTRSPASDVKKLSQDPRILHAAVALVAFTRDESVARHDIAQAIRYLIDRELPIRFPLVEGFAITDRIGNAWCAVALIPLRTHAGED